MSSTHEIDFSQFAVREFDYLENVHKLPEIIACSNEIVKVNAGESGYFYAFSDKTLALLIQQALISGKNTFSFFDGMSSFKANEKIDIATLDALEPRAASYNENDLKSLLEVKKTL